MRYAEARLAPARKQGVSRQGEHATTRGSLWVARDGAPFREISPSSRHSFFFSSFSLTPPASICSAAQLLCSVLRSAPPPFRCCCRSLTSLAMAMAAVTEVLRRKPSHLNEGFSDSYFDRPRCTRLCVYLRVCLDALFSACMCSFPKTTTENKRNSNTIESSTRSLIADGDSHCVPLFLSSFLPRRALLLHRVRVPVALSSSPSPPLRCSPLPSFFLPVVAPARFCVWAGPFTVGLFNTHPCSQIHFRHFCICALHALHIPLFDCVSQFCFLALLWRCFRDLGPV